MKSLFFTLSFILVVSVFKINSVVSKRPETRTKYGVYIGDTIKRLGVEIKAFYGIPYAVSPVSFNRFQRPRPILGTKNDYQSASFPLNYMATSNKPICLQSSSNEKSRRQPISDGDAQLNNCAISNETKKPKPKPKEPKEPEIPEPKEPETKKSKKNSTAMNHSNIGATDGQQNLIKKSMPEEDALEFADYSMPEYFYRSEYPSESEDCLYLNIYAPAEDKKNVPIVVQFPGSENFDNGDVHSLNFSRLIKNHGVIVVTVQYRVGIFGFLKDDIVSHGNMGLWDQIQALLWIQENIKAFGGDPDNVIMISRDSAAVAVAHLLASPLLRNLSRPLFSRAILDWPDNGEQIMITKLSEQKAQVEKVLQKMKLHPLTLSRVLYSVEPFEIAELDIKHWKPVVDGVLVTDNPLEILQNGYIASGMKRLIIGRSGENGKFCILTKTNNSTYHATHINRWADKDDLFRLALRDDYHEPSKEDDEDLWRMNSKKRININNSLFDNICNSKLTRSTF